jgi:hypothetical protein
VTFRPGYAIAALALLAVELLIALFVKDSFVRPYLGDVLAVILVFMAIRAMFAAGPWTAAAIALSVAVVIELGQLVGILHILGLAHHQWLRVVLGTGFDVRDLLAYAIGALIAVGVDRQMMARNVSAIE